MKVPVEDSFLTSMWERKKEVIFLKRRYKNWSSTSGTSYLPLLVVVVVVILAVCCNLLLVVFVICYFYHHEGCGIDAIA